MGIQAVQGCHSVYLFSPHLAVRGKCLSVWDAYVLFQQASVVFQSDSAKWVFWKRSFQKNPFLEILENLEIPRPSAFACCTTSWSLRPLTCFDFLTFHGFSSKRTIPLQKGGNLLVLGECLLSESLEGWVYRIDFSILFRWTVIDGPKPSHQCADGSQS